MPGAPSLNRFLIQGWETTNPMVRKGEKRMNAAGYLNGRLHILCFIVKFGLIRVISFRKANEREARKYGKPKTIDG
jgi:uncharacterized DUF497 family protein